MEFGLKEGGEEVVEVEAGSRVPFSLASKLGKGRGAKAKGREGSDALRCQNNLVCTCNLGRIYYWIELQEIAWKVPAVNYIVFLFAVVA